MKKPFSHYCMLPIAFLKKAARRLSGTGRPKVMMIGIDGASWKVIDPLLNENRLPHLAGLIRNGTRGKIRTLRDKVSPTIWTSAVTGKLPPKHNILAFSTFDPALGKEVPYHSTDRTAKALWNIASEHNKTAGIFNFLVTQPAEKVQGYMVSSGYTPDDVMTAHPPQLCRLLPRTSSKAQNSTDLDTLMRYYRHELDRDIQTSLDVKKHQPVDLFAAYTAHADAVQHIFWAPEKLYTVGKTDKYKLFINDTYRMLDNWIGELIHGCPANTVIMIVSDHGFQENPELYTPVIFKNIVTQLGLSDQIASFWCCDGKDWNYLSYSIPRERVEQLVASITTADGEQIFEITHSDKQGFDMALMQRRVRYLKPDDVIIADGKKLKADECIVRGTVSGAHDFDDGVFIMSGGPARKGMVTNDASVLDLTPTILYLLGLPMAKDMDGKVLTDAIDPRYVEHNPVRYIPSYEDDTTRKSDFPHGPTASYDKDQLDKLRTLGYVQ
jgi:predicted AlkP superfamily phosphohydrolase/phosphomutase